MRFNLLCAGLFCLSLITCAENNDYCSLCQDKGSHTMCKFNPGPDPGCVNYQIRPFTEEEKYSIIELHNKMRNKVALGLENRGSPGPQPSASDMNLVSWDEELSEIAQRWADRCLPFDTTHPHDTCRDTMKYRVGQNIATDSSDYPHDGNVTVTKQAMRWYEEVKDFNSQWAHSLRESTDPHKKVGHYTQLVWSRTKLIGCGRAVFDEMKGKTTFQTVRIVCNYAPVGNIIGAAVYDTGAPCSKCPVGTSCSCPKFEGLCVPPESAVDKCEGMKTITEKPSHEPTKSEEQRPPDENNAQNDTPKPDLPKVSTDKEDKLHVERKDGNNKGRESKKDSEEKENILQIPEEKRKNRPTTVTKGDTKKRTARVPFYKFRRGVWVNGVCYCPLELRSSSSVLKIHFIIIVGIQLFLHFIGLS